MGETATTRARADLDMIFREKHRDYRSTPGYSPRSILRLRAGGTTLVPLDCLTDGEFEDELGRARDARERRLAREAGKRAARASAAGAA